MRDIAISFVLIILIFYSYKKTFISVSLWLWSSVITMKSLVYGFAGAIAFNQIFALITLATYLINPKTRPKVIIDSLSILIFTFFVWTTLSSLFSNAYAGTVWFRWDIFMKIILFYFMAILILEKKLHIDFVIWILVVSVGAIAAGEGLKFIFSGGGHKIIELRGIESDNNFAAVVILTLLPLTFYLISQTAHKLLRLGLIGVSILMILGIIATYSRGGFLGLAILALFFIMSSKNKILWVMFFILIIMSAPFWMPEQWIGRMDTIGTIDEDGSFMHRVQVWKMCVLIAIDNPFFGEGFKSVENVAIWQKYVSDFYLLDFIPTTDVNFNEKTRSAHSIYFQVLSEHGFIGLFLFLAILVTAYFKLNLIISKAIKNNMDEWIINLAKMLKLSLIVYSVTGAAVSAAYLDLFYGVLALVFVLDNRIVDKIIADKNVVPKRQFY